MKARGGSKNPGARPARPNRDFGQMLQERLEFALQASSKFLVDFQLFEFGRGSDSSSRSAGTQTPS